MSDLMFYKNIIPLNFNEHKNTKIAGLSDYSFTSETNAVPLAVIEFSEASKEFPITFLQNQEGEYIPMAILGLQDKQNLFVNAEGNWGAKYLPGYIRRYPFVPSLGDDPDKMNICIDASYAGFDVEEGENLFQDDGSPSPRLDNVIKMIQDFHNQMQLTTHFSERLKACDLFKELEATVSTQDGSQQFSLTGLHIIDEEKLANLDDEKVLEFFKNSEFPLIYNHLNSLSNFAQLVDIFSIKVKNAG